MELKGIDVSKWNGTIDWKKVASSGVQFAMVRAGTGKAKGGMTPDPRLLDNLYGARENGICVGVYLYSYAKSVDAAIMEARALADMLDPYRDLITFPVAYDLEDDSQKSLGSDVCGQMVQSFCSEVRNAGFIPVLYTNPNWLSNYVLAPDDVELWIARWYTSWAGRDCAMWQYTDKGTVPGISGNVDMNISYKDFSKLKGETTMKNTEWSDAINALVEASRMDSPDVWREVCEGKRTASAVQVQALLSKWAEDRKRYDNLADGIREILEKMEAAQ